LTEQIGCAYVRA